MITPTVPADAPFNVQANDYQLSVNDLQTSHRHDIGDIVKKVLLRRFLKEEVRENTQQGIVTDVTLVDLGTDHKIYGHNEDTEHFAASINKLPVTLLLMEELEAGRVTLDTPLSWVASDQRAGNGVYDVPGAPTTGTVREVLHDLLNRSGNTAVRIIVNYTLGSAEAVNTRLALKPELEHTRLIPLDANRFYLGNTTSEESLWVMRQILDNPASYAQVIKELLRTNIFVSDGFRSQLQGNNFIVLVNKTGLLYDPDGNNVHDVGVIYNTETGKSYGYSVLTTSPNDGVTPRADLSIKNMGRAVLRFAGDVEGPAHIQTLGGATMPDSKILY